MGLTFNILYGFPERPVELFKGAKKMVACSPDHNLYTNWGAVDIGWYFAGAVYLYLILTI